MFEQLELFEESFEEKLERKVKCVEEKFDKVRKSLYAKQSELLKLCEEQKYELEILKSALCRCGLEVKISGNSVSFYTLTSS